MSSTNITTVPLLGTQNHSLHIAARSKDILFDLFGEGMALACHDITVAQAKAIIAGLQSAVDEVKENAKKRTPDIELPDYAPAIKQVTVLGTDLTIVNWNDFRGWEVRHSDPKRAGDQFAKPTVLGYISGTNGDWKAKRPNMTSITVVPRVDEALRSVLLQRA